MDSKKTNKLITTVLVIALALILELYAAGRIDNLVASLFGAIVGLLALVFYVIYPELKTREERAEDKIELAFAHQKVPRTREGTIFEVATALILAGSLVMGFVTHMFESRGSNGLFEEYVILFIAAIAALIFAYHPLFFIPIRSSMRVTNEEQFKLLIRKKTSVRDRHRLDGLNPQRQSCKQALDGGYLDLPWPCLVRDRPPLCNLA